MIFAPHKAGLISEINLKPVVYNEHLRVIAHFA